MGKSLSTVEKELIEDNIDSRCDVVLNLILVLSGARDAYLFETANFGNDAAESVLWFESIVDKLNDGGGGGGHPTLNMYFDNLAYVRILVCLNNSDQDLLLRADPDLVNDDVFLAKVLGFQCVDHDYSNERKDRISVKYREMVTDCELKVEVCEASKVNIEDLHQNAILTVDRMNQVLHPLGYNVGYKIKLQYSIKTMWKNLQNEDVDFVETNLDDYLSLLENFYISDPEILETSMTYNKFLQYRFLSREDKEKLGSIFYSAVIKRSSDKYYKNASDLDEIAIVAQKLAKKDRQKWGV